MLIRRIGRSLIEAFPEKVTDSKLRSSTRPSRQREIEMAKRKRRKEPSQSEEIRQFMTKNPNATPNEIAKALKVKPALVYNVKSNLKKKARAKRGQRVAAQPGDGSTADVIAAAKLIAVCGGVDEARAALRAVELVASFLDD